VQSRKPSFPGVDAHDSDRKRVLLAHIIATQFTSPVVTDPSMDYPKDWREKRQVTGPTGHCEDGETICLHSLAVHPEFQGKGLGKVLLRGWVQRVKDAGIAKRIALICHDKYVPFYAKAGFKKLGESKCQYGGGGWFDMVLNFDDQARGDYEL
jgi:GNAT superfamily N-acetyltransferase